MTTYRAGRNKLWRYDIQVGKTRLTGGGFATRREALSEQETRRKQAMSESGAVYGTFQDLVEDYLASSTRSKSDAWVYQLALKLEKGFGHLGTHAPGALKRGHFERVLNEYAADGKAAATVNEYLKLAKAVCNYAVSMGAIDSNPCKGIARMKDRRTREERVKVIPTVDLRKLILGAGPGMLRSLIVTSSQTGSRVNELLNLEWSRVRSDKEQAFCLLATGKTGNGEIRIRPQPLTKMALDAIESQRGKHPKWVFAGRNGQAKYQTVLNALSRLCEAVKVPHYSWHTIRRWAGTTAATTGKSVRAIADFLGQETTGATDHYMKAAKPEVWEIARHLEEQLNADGVLDLSHSEVTPRFGKAEQRQR